MNLDHLYESFCSTPSDINEHLPTIKKYADKSVHITEFGVRGGLSTVALLMGLPKKMISYDIDPIERHGLDRYQLKNEALSKNVDFEFKIGNVLELDIEETDLLFIDTEHSYLQLKSELIKHSSKVRKYIILHDTITYGFVDSNCYGLRDTLGEIDPGDFQKTGLVTAMNEFLEKNHDWTLLESFDNNNGLSVLGRI